MDELAALETAGWDALCTTQGAEFYDGLMSDDALMLFPMGVFDRGESLEAIRTASPWASYQLQPMQLTHPVPDVGILIYHAVATREGSDPYEAWMSSTYMRDEAGNWRLALHQQSPWLMAPLGALSQAWVSAEASLPLGWGQAIGLSRTASTS